MKVELKKTTKIDGKVWHYIYVNDIFIECYSKYDEAKAHFDRIEYAEEKTEVLETKEV